MLVAQKSRIVPHAPPIAAQNPEFHPPPKFTPFPPQEYLLRQQGKLGASME